MLRPPAASPFGSLPSQPSLREPGRGRPPSGPRNLMPVTVGSCSGFSGEKQKSGDLAKSDRCWPRLCLCRLCPAGGRGARLCPPDDRHPHRGRPSAGPASPWVRCVGSGAAPLGSALETPVPGACVRPSSWAEPQCQDALWLLPSVRNTLPRSLVPPQGLFCHCLGLSFAIHLLGGRAPAPQERRTPTPAPHCSPWIQVVRSGPQPPACEPLCLGVRSDPGPHEPGLAEAPRG